MLDTQMAVREVESSGAAEMGTFSIAANGKAFKILIDGLYSRKEEAVVRELWSNALDSHVMAGNADRPFQSHLPTIWEPWFSVRDFGVSLSHEQIMGLYTTIFASTKGTSNLQVGKFGLGSKTPFAYADAFTVTAWLDGEKRIYNAFMDEFNVPRIALFAREPSDEARGLEISFPVEKGHVGNFQLAAKRTMLGFDVVPDLNIDMPKPEMKSKLAGDGWAIYDRDHDLGLGEPMVRQGCVLYPLDMTVLRGVAADALRNECLILDMPIGSVDITPSRETLSYDETTKANLIAKLDTIIDSMKVVAQTTIDAAPSRYDAMEAVYAVAASVASGSLERAIVRNLTWRGRPAPTRIFHNVKDKTLRRRGLNFHSIKRNWDSGGFYVERVENTGRIDLTASRHRTTLVRIMYWAGEHKPMYFKERMATIQKQTRDVYHWEGAWALSNFKIDSPAYKILWHLCGRPSNFASWFINVDEIEFVKPEPAEKSVAQLKYWGDFEWCDFGSLKAPPTAEQKNVYYVQTVQREIRVGTEKLSEGEFTTGVRALIELGKLPSNMMIVRFPSSRKDLAKSIPEAWKPIEHLVESVIPHFNARIVQRRKINSYEIATRERDRQKVIGLVTFMERNMRDGSAMAAFRQRIIDSDKEPVRALHTNLKQMVQATIGTLAYDWLLHNTPRFETFEHVRKELNQRYSFLETILKMESKLSIRQLTEVALFLDMIDAKRADQNEIDSASVAA